MVFVYSAYGTQLYILIASALLRYTFSLLPIDPDGVTNYVSIHLNGLCFCSSILNVKQGAREKISLKFIDNKETE